MMSQSIIKIAKCYAFSKLHPTFTCKSLRGIKYIEIKIQSNNYKFVSNKQHQKFYMILFVIRSSN